MFGLVRVIVPPSLYLYLIRKTKGNLRYSIDQCFSITLSGGGEMFYVFAVQLYEAIEPLEGTRYN